MTRAAAEAGVVGPMVERSIRAGRGPTDEAIARVSAEQSVALGDRAGQETAQALTARLVGLGPLAGVVHDEAVTDVLVNGDGSVWVDRGEGVERLGTSVPVADLRPLAVRLAGLAGQRLDDSRPWVDGALPDGVRLHAVLPPLAEDGPHLSLRVARVRHRQERLAVGGPGDHRGDALGQTDEPRSRGDLVSGDDVDRDPEPVPRPPGEGQALSVRRPGHAADGVVAVGEHPEVRAVHVDHVQLLARRAVHPRPVGLVVGAVGDHRRRRGDVGTGRVDGSREGEPLPVRAPLRCTRAGRQVGEHVGLATAERQHGDLAVADEGERGAVW